MKEVSSWLIAIFLIMFWGFRAVIAISDVFGGNFMIKPINPTVEVILLFVVLGMIPFIFKRHLWAALIVAAGYGYYFGPSLVKGIMDLFNGANMTQTLAVSLFFEVIGLALPIFAIFDILWDKKRTKNPVDTKTDWYYKDEKYDRDLDDRADKNNYRMY